MGKDKQLSLSKMNQKYLLMIDSKSNIFKFQHGLIILVFLNIKVL